jgi:hypothetical protein
MSFSKENVFKAVLLDIWDNVPFETGAVVSRLGIGLVQALETNSLNAKLGKYLTQTPNNSLRTSCSRDRSHLRKILGRELSETTWL